MSTAPKTDQLKLLKSRADTMGINYHKNIGIAALKTKIDAKLHEMQTASDIQVAAAKLSPEQESATQRKNRLRREASRQVRVNVTCMNPNLRGHEGGLYSVGNRVVGMYKEYVPFNTEEGWHIPNIVFKHMLSRKCQIFYTTKNRKGQKIRKGKLINELSIEVLDPLTPDELKDLAIQQARANTDIE